MRHTRYETGRDMVAMTVNLAFCGGLSAGGGFYVECKKLAWRAAGTEIWRVPAGYRRSERSERSRVSKMNGYEKTSRVSQMNGGAAEKGGRHIFISEL